jgi:hypothetical protein
LDPPFGGDMSPIDKLERSYRRYTEYEKIAGKDFFLSVWGYRFVVLVTDLISVPSTFALMMTAVLYKFFKVFLIAADKNVSASVLVAFCSLGMMILCVFVLSWVYFAMRKFTPAFVEALATKISGGKDIEVPKESVSSKPKAAPSPDPDVA